MKVSCFYYGNLEDNKWGKKKKISASSDFGCLTNFPSCKPAKMLLKNAAKFNYASVDIKECWKHVAVYICINTGAKNLRTTQMWAWSMTGVYALAWHNVWLNIIGMMFC